MHTRVQNRSPTTSPSAHSLAVEYRALSSLVPYARNPRTHSERQVAEIAASIKEFGWTNPVLVDAESGIIGKVQAFQLLRLKISC